MITVAYCRECGKSESPSGDVRANIVLQKWTGCGYCGHDQHQTHTIYFCSLTCLCTHLADPEKRKQLEFETEKFRQNRLWAKDDTIIPGAPPV